MGCTCAVVLAVVGWSSTALADFTVTEGQSFTGKVVDVGSGCGPANMTINWGDGTPTSAGTSDGSTGVNGTHTYAEEGTFNGTVSYRCTQLQTDHQKPFQATVVDAPLSSTGRDISGNAGQTLTAVVAHFNDASPSGKVSDFTAQIAWGDGSTSGGSVTSAAGGGFDVTGTHTYGAAGTFTVSTSVADIGGSSTTTQSTARIGAPIPAPPRSTGAPVVSGEPRDREPLATTDGNWAGSPSTFEYQWLRCAKTGDTCVVVPGATKSSYTAVRDDVGSTLRSRVRGRNADGLSLPADSAPTAVVQPFVVRARFTISRNPTCTGVPVTFDASISKTPNGPIKRYRFTEAILAEAFRTYVPGGPWTLADGPNPQATTSFSYDLSIFSIAPYPSFKGLFAANPRLITLTVTDLAGDSASYSQIVNFDPALSNQPRTRCPQTRRKVGHFVKHTVQFSAKKTSASARIPCATTADCAATLLLRTRARRGAKSVVLAKSATVYVPGNQTATITAKLTPKGRALIARGKPLKAIAKFTLVDATGQTTSQSVAATLRKSLPPVRPRAGRPA
jgi:hypothetical protein